MSLNICLLRSHFLRIFLIYFPLTIHNSPQCLINCYFFTFLLHNMESWIFTLALRPFWSLLSHFVILSFNLVDVVFLFLNLFFQSLIVVLSCIQKFLATFLFARSNSFIFFHYSCLMNLSEPIKSVWS